jgi:hypothetical protein
MEVSSLFPSIHQHNHCFIFLYRMYSVDNGQKACIIEPMTYFTILKKEQQGVNIKAGSIFTAKKNGELVELSRVVDFHPIRTNHSFLLSKEESRKLFTKPSSDLDSVIEEAIMICEAEYC